MEPREREHQDGRALGYQHQSLVHRRVKQNLVLQEETSKQLDGNVNAKQLEKSPKRKIKKGQLCNIPRSLQQNELIEAAEVETSTRQGQRNLMDHIVDVAVEAEVASRQAVLVQS